MIGEGPLPRWRASVAAGELREDSDQALAAAKLQSLYNALRGYHPASGGTLALWRERFGLERRREDAPQGLYVFGSVGRGKSMLMDVFFDEAQIAEKRRVHFNAFMLEVQDSLHRWRTEGGGRQAEDPILRLAREITQKSWLLCFDEFQVENIADAMILGRLFSALFDHGAVVVATSNTAPDDLYRDGLQRDRVLPFIDVIKSRLDILELNGPFDYRRDRLKSMGVYHAPLGAAADAALAEAFARLTDDAPGRRESIEVYGRTIAVPRAAKGVAVFDFGELCGAALGAADYLALARRYHTLVLGGVPRLASDRRAEARRFITLIDVLYEHKVNLICAAETAPEGLYPKGVGADAFRRAVSRLHEMQSADYYLARHIVPNTDVFAPPDLALGGKSV